MDDRVKNRSTFLPRNKSELIPVEGVCVVARSVSATADSKDEAARLLQSWVSANPTVRTSYPMDHANPDGTHSVYLTIDND